MHRNHTTLDGDSALGELPQSARGTPVQRVAKPNDTETLGFRIKRGMVEEVENLRLRLLLADLFVLLLPTLCFSRLRTAIYRLAGLNIGAHSLILGRLEFTGSGFFLQHRPRIGAHTIINAHCFFDLNADITIGDWVAIGHHVTFITADHEIGTAHCRAGPRAPKPISIGDGCWIGARSTILPGVCIGHSSVVAAGSVVSGVVPPNKIVGGAPARPLKSLPEP